MTIVFGTDFSEPARRALAAAAAIARVTSDALVVVHVLDLPGAEEILARRDDLAITRFFEGERSRLTALLAREADSARAVGVDVTHELLLGRSDEAVVLRARELDARLVVVGALGRRGAGAWRMGSTADRIAQSSAGPTLVVRDEAPFLAWLRGERALKIVVGVDPSATADAAIAWAGQFAAAKACEIVGIHIAWSPPGRERAGATPGHSGAPDAAAELERDLRERLAAEAPGRDVVLRIVGGLGRPSDHLAQAASEEGADLVVVGTHKRHGLSKLWHGSVSRDVLDRASANVVVVPAT